MGFPPLAEVTAGDELVLDARDAVLQPYEVAAARVVDADGEHSIVYVTRWPVEAADVGGRWRYVVAARRRF